MAGLVSEIELSLLGLLVFYVTCDDISVIYVAGFFNVPVLHRHGTNLFTRWFRHTAPLVAFYDTLGDTEDVIST